MLLRSLNRGNCKIVQKLAQVRGTCMVAILQGSLITFIRSGNPFQNSTKHQKRYPLMMLTTTLSRHGSCATTRTSSHRTKRRQNQERTPVAWWRWNCYKTQKHRKEQHRYHTHWHRIIYSGDTKSMSWCKINSRNSIIKTKWRCCSERLCICSSFHISEATRRKSTILKSYDGVVGFRFSRQVLPRDFMVHLVQALEWMCGSVI